MYAYAFFGNYRFTFPDPSEKSIVYITLLHP